MNVGCHISNNCVCIFLFADDILLLSPTITGLQSLFNTCERELEKLDMRVNAKKSIVKSAKNNYEGVFNARNKGSDIISSKGFKDAKKDLKAERLRSKQKVENQKIANAKIINRSKKSISKK